LNPAAIFWTDRRSPIGFGFWLALSTTTVCPNAAQINPQPGTNVNMVSGTGWPGGDPFLQRQNESQLAFSVRNPLHVVAGANDYRSVDLPFPFEDNEPGDEEYGGDAWLGLFKSFDGGQTWQSTLFPGYPQDHSADGNAFKAAVGEFGAAADPIVRASAAGLIYFGGIAFDRNPSGNPTRGALFVGRLMDLNNKENGDVTAGLDPIRYIDAAKLEDTSASAFIDKPAMAVDMPRGGSTCTLMVPQGSGSPVPQTIPAGNVYVAYSSFSTTGDGTIYLRSSSDCGQTWGAALRLSTAGQRLNQGASVVVDPPTGNVYVAWRQFAVGFPGDTGYQPNAIKVAKVTGGGTAVASVVTPPGLSLPPVDPLDPTAETFFDQATTVGSFRTNAYPTLAVDGSGRLYLAWSQRQPFTLGDARIKYSTSLDGVNWNVSDFVDNNPVADEALPTANAYTRGHQIMPQWTFNGGRLTAIYYDLRIDHTLGLFNPVSLFPHPDGQGRFELETRAPCASPTTMPCAGETQSGGSPVFTPFIVDTAFQLTDKAGNPAGPVYPGLTVRRHTLDVRLAQAGPGPSPVFTTKRLSQYKFGTRGDEATGVDSPDGPTVQYVQQLEFNPPNLPIFQLGRGPFFSDYLAVDGVTFVQSSAGGPWVFNTAPSKAGNVFASWTSNQDVVPPYDPVRGIVDWTLYTPPRSPANTGDSIFRQGQRVPSCEAPFAGSRNQNIYGALITQDFLFSSPQNSKPLSNTLQRAFVVVAQNLTNFDKSFRLVIQNQPAGGWASFTPGFNKPVLTAPSPLTTTLDLAVAAHSSASRSVFATSTDAAANITVNIAETSSVGGPLVVNGLTGFVVLNSDSTVPGLVPPDGATGGDVGTVEVYTPNITNPNITNPNITNPNITNSSLVNPNITNPNITNPNITNPNITNADVASLTIGNPNITNPNITNPNITNPNITNLNPANPNITNPNITNASPTDAVYTVTSNANTSASYRIKLVGSVDPGVITQLIVTKTYKTLASQNCDLFEQSQELLVTNVLNPTITPPGSNLTDPEFLNPGIDNLTVVLRPNESATITLRAFAPPSKVGEIVSSVTPVVVPQAANTDNPNNTPTAVGAGGTPINPGAVQILTSSLPDAVVGVPYSAKVTVTGGTPPYFFDPVTPPDGITFAGGVFSGTPTGAATTTSFTIVASDSSIDPLHDSRDLTIRVAPVLNFSSFSLANGTIGSPYAAALDAGGGLAPYHFSIASGSLPAGLALSTGGAITGSPLVAGTSTFKARVMDSLNPAQSAIQSFSITVDPATPPFITFTVPPVNVVAGQPFDVQVRLLDGAGASIPSALMSLNLGTAPCAGTEIGGGLTGTTNSDGYLTFTNVVIDRGGVGATLHASATVVGAPPIVGDSHHFGVQGFCGTGSMNAARKWHTATRLSDGRVLIAGGHDGTTALKSTEIYDPVTHVFTAIEDMGTARALHSATLLPSGKVLVVGGGSGFETGTLATAELYDPVTGHWSATGPLTGNSRQMHGAVLLNDGTVLVVGGFTNDGADIFGLATAELYNPGSGSFTATSGNMSHDRIMGFTTTLLADGRVLVAGGYRNFVGGSVDDADIFSPDSGGSFGPAAGAMNAHRALHSAERMSNGQVFLAGGESDTGLEGSTEFFDPSTNSFVVMSGQPVLATPREEHSATRLVDTTILHAGGAGNNDVPFVLSSAELYGTAMSGTGLMTGPRRIHTATPLNDGTVLLVGGASTPPGAPSEAVLNTAEIFHLPVYVDPTPSYSLAQISDVSLNSGGNVLVLPGGGSFTLDHDFVVANSSFCPGCIEQIEVGLAGTTNYQACTYDGIPSLAGDSGHGSTTLTVPSAPGLYYIGFDYAATYFCGQFPAWWSGPPTPIRYMGIVIVP
jgi:hypothetical protein